MTQKDKALDKIYIRSLGGDKRRGILQAGHLCLPCSLGYSGIKAQKREGDLATPRATMTIITGFYRKRSSRLALLADPHKMHLKALQKHDGWCDVSNDAKYNQYVRLPYSASAEKLYRDDDLYDIVIVLNWNIKPRIKGRGSAVFLHIARPKTKTAVEAVNQSPSPPHLTHATSLYHPTAGCISISAQSMRQILPFLKQGTKIEVLG